MYVCMYVCMYIYIYIDADTNDGTNTGQLVHVLFKIEFRASGFGGLEFQDSRLVLWWFSDLPAVFGVLQTGLCNSCVIPLIDAGSVHVNLSGICNPWGKHSHKDKLPTEKPTHNTRERERTREEREKESEVRWVGR